jgi:enoyl-CoA hydratase/carnithine racemase
MEYMTINVCLEDGIKIVTLNRPGKLNAFTELMAQELMDVFARANEDDETLALVVTGAAKAFCAGMDLSQEGNVFGLNEALAPTLHDLEHRAEDPEILHGVRDLGGRLALQIFQSTKPVVAAINGSAIGIGATMTLPMDFRFASPDARIGFVFGRVGIVLDACSSWFLPRVVGLEKALEWAYRADVFSAEEALASGLVRALYPQENLLQEACSFARSLVQGRSPVSIAHMRQLLHRASASSDPWLAHQIESLAIFYASTADGKEGVAAFREKRAPLFQSKASQMPSFFPWW